MNKISRSLVIAYGNPDRQDDGVAWHVLKGIADRLKVERFDAEFPDAVDPTGKVRLIFLLQLVPELAEELAGFSRVCFIDAHTADISEAIRAIPLEPQFKSSPFTHHLTPEMLLEISRSVYKKSPSAYLVSIKGYLFEFSDSLSERTEALVPEAVEIVMKWLDSDKDQ